MRLLVAGPYPPMPGREANATLRLVRDLVDAGDDVVVVSPAPSAAHHHADLGGARGVLRFGRLARGADRAILRLDASGLVAGGDPAAAIAGRIALSLVLRRIEHEVHVDRVPETVSSRWARLVLGRASSITVSTTDEQEALIRAGVDRERVDVQANQHDEGVGAGQSANSWHLSQQPSRAEVQAAIRARAAAARTATATSGGPARPDSASRPLRMLAPLGPAPARSPKPGVGAVKRAVRRLVAWQVEPVIQHVNQLHEAAIEAVENINGAPTASPADRQTAQHPERSGEDRD